MKIPSAAAGVALAAALSAAACAEPPTVNDPADLAKVDALRTGFTTAMNTGDAAAYSNLYVPDGISAPNHEKTLRGRDAIVEWQKTSFSQFTYKVNLTAEETRTMGDFGFDRGTFRLTLTPKAGGDPIAQDGRYLVLLQKEADGTWKVSRDIDNSSMPMPPAPPVAAADAKK